MKNKTVCYSAPLYLVISGKDGIPFGKPALSMAINYRVEVRVSFISKKVIQPDSRIIEIEKEVRSYVASHAKISNASDILYDIKIPKLSIDNVFISLTTACVAALLELLMNEPPQLQLINSLTHQILKKQSKKQMGLESSTVCFGGLVYFRKEFEFLKGIYQLPYNIPKNIEKYLAISIESFKEKTIPFSKEHLKHYEDIEKLTKRIVLSFIKEDVKLFKESTKQLERQKNKNAIFISATDYGNQKINLYFIDNIQSQPEFHPCVLSKNGIVKIH